MRTSRASGVTHSYRCVAPAPGQRRIRTSAAFAASLGPHRDASRPGPGTRSAPALRVLGAGVSAALPAAWQSGRLCVSRRVPTAWTADDHTRNRAEETRCPEAVAKAGDGVPGRQGSGWVSGRTPLTTYDGRALRQAPEKPAEPATGGVTRAPAHDARGRRRFVIFATASSAIL